MASPTGPPHDSYQGRPVLQRARSNSSPSRKPSPTAATDGPAQPARPHHVRAHSSFQQGSQVSENETAPRSSLERANQPSTEKTHRLHFPGRHHSHRQPVEGDVPRRRSKLHRYTQSLADQHHHTNSHAHPEGNMLHSSRLKRRNEPQGDGDTSDSFSTQITGINAERKRQQHAPGESTSTKLTSPGSLQRVMSSRSYRGIAATDGLYAAHDPTPQRPYDLHRRVTSDPPNRDPATTTNSSELDPKVQIELDLERAERLKRENFLKVTPADISKRDAEIRAAEDELHEKLQQISHAGMEITRRLDYGFYNLLEKVGNLASVIHNFQSLASQSQQMIVHLDDETHNTDESIRHKVDGLKTSFDERENRVKILEDRGRKVQRRAEELSARLERARERVEEWEKREIERQKVWNRFLLRVWWMVLSVVVLVVALVVAREVFSSSTGESSRPRRGGLVVGDGDGGLVLEGASMKMNIVLDRVPQDVREVLLDIEQRNRGEESSQEEKRVTDDSSGDGKSEELLQQRKQQQPPPWRVLDEL